MSEPPRTVPVQLTSRQAGVVVSILFTYAEVYNGVTAGEGVAAAREICAQTGIDPADVQRAIRSELRGVPRWLLRLRGK